MNANAKVLFTVFIITSTGFVSTDFNQDKEECDDQLADFSACLPFVGGKAKSPTPTCCSNIRNEGSNTRKCLLVKDRNEPSLGFKMMNATLALSLLSVAMLWLMFLVALVPFQHNKIFVRRRPCIITIHIVQTASLLKISLLVIYQCSASKPASKFNGCTGLPSNLPQTLVVII